jgi:DNA-binding XRE family transcriptional regulator
MTELKRLRMEKFRFQREFADKAGLSAAAVGGYETGYFLPNITNAIALADALGILDLRDLFPKKDLDKHRRLGKGQRLSRRRKEREEQLNDVG